MSRATVATERARAVAFLRQWAENMRRAETEAARDENGKASLFSDVGLAEAQGLDLEGAAVVLDAAADALAEGKHAEQLLGESNTPPSGGPPVKPGEA